MNQTTSRYDSFEIGDSAEQTKVITEEMIHVFADLSGDYNPLHTDEVFASTTQFGKRIAYGTISNALISAVIGMKLPGKGALYLSQNVAYKKPVFIGDTLTAKGVVIEKFTKRDGELKFLRLKTDVYNQEGVVVTEGEAVVLLMD